MGVAGGCGGLRVVTRLFDRWDRRDACDPAFAGGGLELWGCGEAQGCFFGRALWLSPAIGALVVIMRV